MVWDELCPNGAALEFRVLAPEETANLEGFVEALGDAVGFDLEKGWACMDTSRQNWITEGQFREGASKFAFKGSVKLLFDGLCSDSSLKRLHRDDFFYLQHIARNAERKPLIAEFVHWVELTQGSMSTFAGLVGLEQDGAELSVKDFTEYLTALGFPGDAHGVAAQVAHAQGGTYKDTTISAESLVACASGAPRAAAAVAPGPPKSPKRPVPRWDASKASSDVGQGWDNSVDNTSLRNVKGSKHLRSYFDTLLQEKGKDRRKEQKAKFEPAPRSPVRCGPSARAQATPASPSPCPTAARGDRPRAARSSSPVSSPPRPTCSESSRPFAAVPLQTESKDLGGRLLFSFPSHPSPSRRAHAAPNDIRMPHGAL